MNLESMDSDLNGYVHSRRAVASAGFERRLAIARATCAADGTMDFGDMASLSAMG